MASSDQEKLLALEQQLKDAKEENARLGGERAEANPTPHEELESLSKLSEQILSGLTRYLHWQAEFPGIAKDKLVELFLAFYHASETAGADRRQLLENSLTFTITSLEELLTSSDAFQGSSKYQVLDRIKLLEEDRDRLQNHGHRQYDIDPMFLAVKSLGEVLGLRIFEKKSSRRTWFDREYGGEEFRGMADLQ